ncbi:hypothetical protein Rxycam_02816 [Rubrobacter xylanophilus DSM 9941]|uniref:hypothetical protein n=1 Tax=Rubrobacter xylanophilus TaxID=49319 RepID=UPI001C63FBBB|nr:hypothetical protein [Rubrobacter xylanophilus]QYJ16979.1 hypothetical protein Rxycam_02816 [Rubrobacter xylanophilus DSM 9941]
MKGALIWSLATVLSFLAAAGMFLLLANMSARSYNERSLEPRRSSPSPTEDLRIILDKERLASLKQREGQSLRLGVRNTSGEELESVEVRVEVFSEDTAVRERRSYREEVGSLPPGKTAHISLELDLSPLAPPDGTPPEQPRKILEVRASAEGRRQEVKTAILPPG